MASVAAYTSWRNGDAAWRSPVWTGARSPTSQAGDRWRTAVRRRSAHRLDQLADQAVGGRQRQAARAASSVRLSIRCRWSNAPSRGGRAT